MALVTADLISQNCLVMMPVSATCPFDLGIIFEGKFYRVQVKYRSTTNGRVEVKPMRASHRFKTELNTDFDILAVYNPDVNKVAYVAEGEYGNVLSLRVIPSKNNQQKGIIQFTNKLNLKDATDTHDKRAQRNARNAGIRGQSPTGE